MLSRVAESLYWMARYIERAEAVSRLASVNFQALLDGGRHRGWDGVVRITGDVVLFRELCPDGHEQGALEFLLSHPANPSSVVACLARARENARGVRDQISSEMWEHLNRLYMLVRDGRAKATSEGPYDFFREVRGGSQAFEGITAATMPQGEAYHHIHLGRYLERGATTVQTVAVRYQEVRALDDGTAAASLELIALLKSCGAFEPFRRHHGSQLQAASVTEYLLLNTSFPRAVLFCLDQIAATLAAVAPASARAAQKADPPGRLLGRLRADLAYLDVSEVLGDGLDPFLTGLLQRIYQVGDEVTRTYFNTRVILPVAKSAAGGVQQQQQQQQQARRG
jgi:uncharacterized alpha-E superfamily protein